MLRAIGFWPVGQKQRVSPLFVRHRSSPRRHRSVQTAENYTKPCLSTGLCSVLGRSPRSVPLASLTHSVRSVPDRPPTGVKHRGFWPFGQKQRVGHLFCTVIGGLGTTSRPVSGETGHRAIAVLIGSGRHITLAIGVLGDPSRPFLWKRPSTYCCAHWILPHLVIYLVTARRQDGQTCSERPNLHKSLLIQQAFAPVRQFFSGLPFAFPRSQCTICARSYTHGRIKQGFGRGRPKLANRSTFY